MPEAAQAFLRETEVAQLDSKTYPGRFMPAMQAFVQAVHDQAGIAWKDDPSFDIACAWGTMQIEGES